MSVPEAKVICDSISDRRKRLTTFEVKCHRFVLAEFNTHRDFSRNSASSRAIPTSKIIDRVMNDPALPVWWGKNQPGMSAYEELSFEEKQLALQEWMSARDCAVYSAQKLLKLGTHKQIVNRLLEPFMWHHMIISTTELSNFFAQRCHPDAQPEMRAAAMAMQLAYYQSKPFLLDNGFWHLPYLQEDEISLDTETKKKISAARCARVSYLSHDGKRDIEKDLDLYNKLASASPMHASPFEHVATPAYFGEYTGNFKGWKQFRSDFSNERVNKFTPNHPDLIS
jgi:thymidylate synthase ThyX